MKIHCVSVIRLPALTAPAFARAYNPPVFCAVFALCVPTFRFWHLINSGYSIEIATTRRARATDHCDLFASATTAMHPRTVIEFHSFAIRLIRVRRKADFCALRYASIRRSIVVRATSLVPLNRMNCTFLPKPFNCTRCAVNVLPSSDASLL